MRSAVWNQLSDEPWGSVFRTSHSSYQQSSPDITSFRLCAAFACTQTGSDVITLDSHKQEVDLTDQMCCFWLISLCDQNQWVKNRTINNFPVRLSSVFIDVSDQFTSCLNWSLNSMCSYLWKGSNLNRQSVIDWSVKLQRLSMCIAHVYLSLLSLSDNQYDEDDDEITPDLWQEACWIVIR